MIFFQKTYTIWAQRLFCGIVEKFLATFFKLLARFQTIEGQDWALRNSKLQKDKYILLISSIWNNVLGKVKTPNVASFMSNMG